MVRYRSAIFITVIALAVSISGCTSGQDVTPIVKALPEVQQFLEEHPNAKIIVTYWSKEDVEKFEEEISKQCDKPITPAAMYKATVSEGNLKIISWINEENQKVICSITEGEGAQITPAPTPAATPLIPATTVARVTSTAQVDYQSYCSEKYPGSVYDPAKHKCIAYTTPIPTSTAQVDYQSYCSANYPGSVYDPAENACVYPQTSYYTPTQTPYSTSTPTQTSTSTKMIKGTITVTDVYKTYAEAVNYGDGLPYAPVRGASVYVDGVLVGTTDSAGKLAVELPTDGSYHTFKVSATGFIDNNFQTKASYGYAALMYSTDVRVSFKALEMWNTYGPVVQGASIYIDGALAGTTDSAGKLERILISKGKHTFKVSATGFDDGELANQPLTGYPLYTRDVTGPVGELTFHLKSKDVRVPLGGAQGDSVYVDGVFVGAIDSAGKLEVLVSRGSHTFKIGDGLPLTRDVTGPGPLQYY
ncbi:MAG: hypothetical protein WC568_07320 [Candidatus Methanoperedens sp.]